MVSAPVQWHERYSVPPSTMTLAAISHSRLAQGAPWRGATIGLGPGMCQSGVVAQETVSLHVVADTSGKESANQHSTARSQPCLWDRSSRLPCERLEGCSNKRSHIDEGVDVRRDGGNKYCNDVEFTGTLMLSY